MYAQETKVLITLKIHFTDHKRVCVCVLVQIGLSIRPSEWGQRE